jgi:hypothetical protein
MENSRCSLMKGSQDWIVFPPVGEHLNYYRRIIGAGVLSRGPGIQRTTEQYKRYVFKHNPKLKFPLDWLTMRSIFYFL